MSIEEPTSQQLRQLRRRQRRTVLLLVLIAGVGGFVWLRFFYPEQLLAQARAKARFSPIRAELLAADAFWFSGGTNAAAGLLRVELLVKLNQTEAAIGAFSLIDSPQQLPATELISVADKARQAQMFLLARNLLEAAARSPETAAEDRQLALRKLILLHIRLGDQPAATRYSEQLIKQIPTDPLAQIVIGDARLYNKQHQAAQAAFRIAAKHANTPQQELAARQRLLNVLIDQGLTEQALSEWNTASQRLGSSGGLWLCRARIARLQGDPQSALEFLSNINPSNPGEEFDLRSVRSSVYLDQQQYQAAIDDFQFVITQQPTNFQAHYKLALCYRQLGNDELAQTHQQLADRYRDQQVSLLELSNQLRAHPENAQLRERVARLYEQSGQPEQANRLRGFRPANSALP